MRTSTAYKKEMTTERRNDILVRRGVRYAYEEVLAEVQQRGSTVHVGGRSAFSVLGSGMYGEMRAAVRLLFGQPGEPLPSPLAEHDWGLELVYLTPDLLPPDLGVTTIEQDGYSVRVSDLARALLEGLAVVPEYQCLEESSELMELQRFLDPQEVQSLLEACANKSVTRTFLHLAESAGCEWVNKLNMQRIGLGEGETELGVAGMEEAEPFYFEFAQTENRKKFYEKYQIWLPAGLGEHEKRGRIVR